MHALYMHCADDVKGLCVRLTRSRELGLEVAQETFLTAFESLEDLENEQGFLEWVLQLAARGAHRHLKRSRRWFARHSSDGALGLSDLAVNDLGAEARSELMQIDRALLAVSPEQRLAWVLRRVEDEPLENIARSCECSVATVKRWVEIADVHVRRAREGEA